MKKEHPTQKDPSEILEKLASSTHAPQGQYGARAGYELLEKRIFPHKKRTFILPVWARIAAAVILLLAGWWMVQDYGESDILLFETTAQTQTIELSDGSRVILNRYSALTVPKHFKGKSREVELKGEALFEVAKDAAKPFRVLTGEVYVEVLGTIFNVNAYQENQEIVTTLLEGSVAVRESENGQELLLSPGERAVYSLNEKELIHYTEVNAEEITGWQKGNLIFSGESMENIARTLSNHFNIPVKVSDKTLSTYKVTADFTENEDLETILNLLIHVAPFSWERADQTIILTPKID